MKVSRMVKGRSRKRDGYIKCTYFNTEAIHDTFSMIIESVFPRE